MRFLFIIALLFAVISFTVCAEPSENSKTEQTIYDRIYKKSELPTGGEFVKHPKKHKVQYYFTNRMLMWEDKSNVQKHSGLYITENNGNTWKLLCMFFQFKRLFIHPETGVLYAVIHYTRLMENKAGFLWPHSGDKALMSKDGKHWKDITGGRGSILDIGGIIVDPDNPKRVCLQACVLRPYVLQSEDNAYSRWNWYRAWDWPKRKEQKTSWQRNAPVMKGAISLADAIGIKSLGFVTVTYSPTGFLRQDHVTAYINDQRRLESLLEVLSHFPAKGGTYKSWPPGIARWLVCMHGKKVIVLNIYNYSLQSPIDGSFSSSTDDPQNTKLMKLLKEMLKSNKRD